MKKSLVQNKPLNTDMKIVNRLVFDFNHNELLTPTLLYIWNAEPDELEQLADEIIGRMSPDFINRYVIKDLSIESTILAGMSKASLLAAFYELCRRADNDVLIKMATYLSGVMTGRGNQ